MVKSNRISHIVWLISLLLFVPVSIKADTNEKQLTFALFAPRADSFWPKLEAFMKDACRDLQIRCLVYYSDNNPYKMKRQLESAISGADKVDAVIFQNYKQQGEKFIQLADQNNVASFLINAPLSEKGYQLIGKPREKYKTWLGEMIPNDQQAGYLITNKIIDDALNAGKQNSNGKIKLIAFNGIVSDGAAIEREKGLRKALKERKREAHLYQYFTTRNWSQSEAILKYTGALNRYPDANAIWTGGDDIALGIIKTAKHLKLTPGKDFFIAGINWSKEGIEAVKKGEMAVNVGGHFLEAAWVTILLYDYFHGIDFKNKEGLQIKSPMYPIDKNNYQDINTLLYALDNNEINFTYFSKYQNPNIKKYHFDVSEILKQIKE
ncbi:ABC transporter substrate-binding protein [Vibrio salinus]|uniref:ABC transporter substrate-binding protein n=1 Tax=Vibrio salinus TaxID=2899784 RepID=UPI001E355875|nr:ABC transporter substrate-binding protein [Vibrio salinus]MCE0494609.1 ABC transporter substrate-binding protein [Vibrio salinus]